MPLSDLLIEAVPPLYQKSLGESLLKEGRYHRPFAQNGGEPEVYVYENITLWLSVEPQSHTVKDLGYLGVESPVVKRLLDRLCDLMQGRPVNECYDHAVIYLEYELRDKSMKRTHRGLTTPLNSWDAFRTLLGLVRGIIHQYKVRVDFIDTKNFYVHQPLSAWLTQTQDEKMQTITRELSRICRDYGCGESDIQIVDLPKVWKVVLYLEPRLYEKDRDVMMKIESLLKQRVEPHLSVYLEEEKDKNKIRWAKPPKSQIVKEMLR